MVNRWKNLKEKTQNYTLDKIVFHLKLLLYHSNKIMQIVYYFHIWQVYMANYVYVSC
jgi:hypothetical protein